MACIVVFNPKENRFDNNSQLSFTATSKPNANGKGGSLAHLSRACQHSHPFKQIRKKNMREMTYQPIAWAVLAMIGGMVPAAPSHAQASDAASPASAETLDAVTVVGTVGDLHSLDFYAPNSSAVLN